MGILDKIRARFRPARKAAEVFELAHFSSDHLDSRFVRTLRPFRAVSSASTALPADAPAAGSKPSITNRIFRTVGGIFRKAGQVLSYGAKLDFDIPTVETRDTESTIGHITLIMICVIILFAVALALFDDEDSKQARDCKECKECKEDRSDIGPLGLGAAPFG